VEPQTYAARHLDIEPDASSASYFFAAAAATGREVVVEGLGTSSLQGDLGFVEVLREMGAAVRIEEGRTVVRGVGKLRGVRVDMQEISDTFMTLAAIAPFAEGSVRIEGIAHTRVKETDRVEAVAENLRTLGVPVRTGENWIEIQPAQPTPGLIRCHRDHRIAMSFSVLGLLTPGVRLDDPACVAKTFPDFHEQLGAIVASWQLDAA
jgi:3-phosphoshikimate 1-carboxyvinyltransferase